MQMLISLVCNRIYERNVRRKLKNDEFSIICSNCIGGLIYQRVGKQFLSPTINLWINQTDFLRFITNLREYLSYELVFVESDYDYPVAVLKDIKIYFTHYKTEEDAKDCWERRKTRINFDNMFLIMYDRDGITEEDILKLQDIPCRGKVVLSDKKHESIDYVYTLRPSHNPNGYQFVDSDWFGIRTFEKQFDYVTWLNCAQENAGTTS